jgi:hypothetical protein
MANAIPSPASTPRETADYDTSVNGYAERGEIMRIDGPWGARLRTAAILYVAGTASIVAVTSAAAQPASYDGVYAGQEVLTENSSDQNYSQCLKGPFKRKLILKDGTATYTYNPTTQALVTGTVSADGDVSAGAQTPSGGVSLSGKIAGDQFTGEIWSLYCTYSLQLKRVP